MTAYVSDFVVVESNSTTPAPICSIDPLNNPSFQQGLSSWIPSLGVDISTAANNFFSAVFMTCKSNATTITQSQIGTCPGATYRLEFSYWLDRGTADVNFGNNASIAVSLSDGTILGSVYTRAPGLLSLDSSGNRPGQ